MNACDYGNILHKYMFKEHISKNKNYILLKKVLSSSALDS